MTKLARFFLRAVVWVLFGLGLSVGIFLGRLSSGPVVLDWMKPRIELALTPGNSDIRAVIGRTELRLDESGRTIELVGLDVRYLAGDGRSFLTFPEVEVALSVEAFLKHGLVAASRVEAHAPSLRLTRSEDGVIGLSSVEMDGEALSQVDFAAFLRHFVLAPKSDDRIAFLKRLQISGGRVSYDDQTRAEVLTANAADLVLIRRDDEVSGWLRADLVQTAGQASLQLLGRVEVAGERVQFDGDITDLVIADLAPALRSDFPWLSHELDQIRSPIQASIKGSLDFDGSLSPLSVEVQMVDGLLDLPDHLANPLEVTLGELKGVVAPGFDGVDIEQFRLVSRSTELKAKGRVSWRNDEAGIDLDLTATNVRAEDLPTFWPPGFGEEGRAWVVENIKTGFVPRAEARLELRADDFSGEPLRDDALNGTFTFEEVSVRYVDTMPPVEKGSGTASFDADQLFFDVTSGDNAGIDLIKGTVTITGLGKPGREATQLRVLADVKGPVDKALALLDHPPLDVAKDLEIAPERASGALTAKLDIRMPLHDEVTDDEVDVLADAELDDVAIVGLPRLDDDVRLDNGNFQLTIDTEKVRLDGTAVVAGLPLAINIEEPRIEGTAKRRIFLEGQLTQTTLDRLDMIVDGVDGTLAFKATLTETAENIWVDLDTDLTELIVAIPGIVWQKTAGNEGRLLASIVVPNEGAIEVKQFELTARDLRATGSLRLSQQDYGVSELSLTDIEVGNNAGGLRFQRNGKAVPDIVIDAKTLDLDSLFSDTGDDGAGPDLDHVHLVMHADRLVYKGVELQDMQVDAFRKEGEWRTASFLGALLSGGEIALELVRDGDVQRLDIRSDDAGALINALDLGRRIEGGAFHLAATLASQDPMIAEGRLEIGRFTLGDAPLLARLLTVASLTGIGNLLEGEGIQVDHLILPFSMQDQKITLTDGLLRGSQLGLTTKGTIDLEEETFDLAGTIIPVYSLNRLIGQVPIIGRILTGTEGRGAFAATYRISGPKSQPTVYVNPLSMLTPGLLRDFFGGLVNGTLTPPELRETDD